MSEQLPEFSTRRIDISIRANTPFIIEHALNRLANGWLVVDTDAPVTIWRSGKNTTDLLELTADRDANIGIVIL